MKNLKLATKISIMAVSILAVGLFILWLGVTNTLSRIMKESVIQNMNKTVSARKEVIDQYVKTAEDYLAGYGQNEALTDAIINKDNPNKITRAQDYTESYASVNAELENIYLADYNSTVLASYVTGAIGITLREGESLEQLNSNLYASTNVFNTGVMASKSTGQQVISMYYPIYDNETPIGFAGGAICVSGLYDRLENMDAVTGKMGDYYILDAAKGLYISCEDESLAGGAIEDTNLLTIMNMAAESKAMGTYEFGNKLALYDYIEDYNWALISIIDSSNAFSEIQSMKIGTGIICLTLCIICSILIYMAVKFLSKDLNSISDVLENISTLDLSSKQELEKYATRKDEVGIISKASLQLTEAVGTTVGIIQENSKTLEEASKQLVENVDLSTDSIRSMKSAIHEIAECTTNQAMDSQTAASNVTGIGKKIEDTMKEIEHLNHYATTIQETGKKLLGTVNSLTEMNDVTKQAIDNISAQTLSTNESASKIREATKIITSIAEETNLLSLNATIEAARAGEQGKGFAVVAGQIQALADQSNSSAQLIESIINTLILDSENAVDSMNQMKEVVYNQVSQLDQTREQFEQIYHDIGITKDGVQSIYNTVSEMDQDRTVVVSAVENLSIIAENNAASTEETLATTEMINGLIDSISTITTNLASIANVLNENIAQFKVD